MFDPTAEQDAAIKAFSTGKSIVLEAGAGSGKTSTLKLLAQSTTADGIYVAYNKSIATEASGKFPRNVKCSTAHSLAYRAVGHGYRGRLNSDRVPAWKVAKILKLDGQTIKAGERILASNTLASLAMQMVAKFCQSADPEITAQHGPFVEGIEALPGVYGPNHRELARFLLPYARKAWADLQRSDDQGGGALRFDHGHYLKLWQLQSPVIEADFILFDEAQDANPVIASIVGAQDVQRVYVGDKAQAIYGWNGAIDALSQFPADAHLYLSESFRFGEAIAAQANLWLDRLDTPLRIRGQASIPSVVGSAGFADATLCRTNGGAIQAALDAQEAGVAVHVVGDNKQITDFVRGADDLINKGSSWHRDLALFRSWEEVQTYCANDPDGADLTTLVNLVDRYGTTTIIEALGKTVSEAKADLIVSTAHKAKGREWDSVRIGSDFEPKRDKDGNLKPLTAEEVMLRYVAVTRAKLSLDIGPLAAYQEVPV